MSGTKTKQTSQPKTKVQKRYDKFAEKMKTTTNNPLNKLFPETPCRFCGGVIPAHTPMDSINPSIKIYNCPHTWT